jgi:hypothetical protein
MVGTLTVKSPRALNFKAPSPVKERKIEVLPNGEISLHIIYEDDTKLVLTTSHGSVHVSVNELVQTETTQDQVDLSVMKQTKTDS